MRLPSWNSRQVLFIGIGGLLLIVCLVVATFSLLPEAQTADDQALAAEESNINRQARRVFVKDFYKYKETIDAQTQRSIEHAMYGYVSQSEPDLYTGVIRQGSYLSTTTSDGLLNITFLVDVEPSKVTYKNTVVMRPNTDFQNVSIVCAPQELQIAKSTSCKDEP